MSDSIKVSSRILALQGRTTLTIASGVVTATRSCHAIDTQSGAATDDLDTINITSSTLEYPFLLVMAANDTRDVVLKHNTGNIYLRGGADITLDTTNKAVLLVFNGSKWVDL